MAAKKVKEPVEEVVEPVEAVDTPEVVPVEVDHGDVVSIYRAVTSGGDGILNVRFADGVEEQHPCDDAKWEAFQADETDWAKKAKKFYGSL